jgi:hypothetical protein
MNDLVARLRDVASECETPFMSLEAKAADAIEALQAEVERKMSAGQHLLKEIAARDLVIKQMREALEEWDHTHYGAGLSIQEALSLQHSTEALDAYVAEKVKENNEMRCATCSFRNASGYCTSGKLADNWGQQDSDKADMALYDFNESGGFWVGEKFGCVHHSLSARFDARRLA